MVDLAIALPFVWIGCGLMAIAAARQARLIKNSAGECKVTQDVFFPWIACGPIALSVILLALFLPEIE